MSSGGMDWAYRMIAAHNLDPLGGLIVLHLGWRDHADLRTDRGIARALNQHRASIQKATAKLVGLGIIVRRSGQWVACETVAIVEQSKAAQRPTELAADDVRPPVDTRPTELAGGGLLSGPLVAYSVGHKRKENLENRGKPVFASRSARRASPLPAGGQAARGAVSPVGRDGVLSPFQRSRILSGQSVLVDGETVLPGSVAMLALMQAVRSESAVNKVGVA